MSSGKPSEGKRDDSTSKFDSRAELELNKTDKLGITDDEDYNDTDESMEILKQFEDDYGSDNNDEDKENKKPEDKGKAVEEEHRGKPSACVFVASLCATKNDDELWYSVTNHFAVFGRISAVKVLRDTANRPYAFVQYYNEHDSNNAIRLGNKSILDGRHLRCEAAKVNRTLFIDFYRTLSMEEVRKTLAEFGEIEDFSSSNNFGVIRFDGNVKSRFWFVKFVYRDDAIRAFAHLTNDSNFEVKWAQNIDHSKTSFKSTYTPVRRYSNNDVQHKFDNYSIFIGQLSPETTKEDLQERFSKHGKIENINLIHKENNVFAFIKFEEETGAARSVESENHSMFLKKTIHVQYKEYHGNKKILNESKGIQLAPSPINSGNRFSRKKRYDYYLIPGNSMGNQRQHPRFSHYDNSNQGPSPGSGRGNSEYKKGYPFGIKPPENIRSYSPKSANGEVVWEFQR